ncbi:MAG: hypothetical protein R3B49_10185 [Phycisphaerales bacterium]
MSNTPGLTPANFLMADETEDNYTSAAVTYSLPEGPPDIIIDFLIPSTAVAMDITGNPNGVVANVEVFSGATSLGSFPVAGTGAGTFFGFESTGALITRVEIDGGSYNGVDNIAYSRPCENFEDANLMPAQFTQIPGNVIDSYTNDAVFSPGDIVQWPPRHPVTPGNLYMTTAGFANYTSDTITYGNNNAGGPELNIYFPNGAGYFSFDLTGNPDGAQALVSVYSGSTFVDSAVFNGTAAGTFVLGFSPPTRSPSSPSTTPGAGGFNGVDNVCFGSLRDLRGVQLAPGGFTSPP